MDDDPIIAAAQLAAFCSRPDVARGLGEPRASELGEMVANLASALDAQPACWPWRSPDAPPEPDAARRCWVRWTSESGKEHVSGCCRVKNNGVPCWWSVDHQWILDEESVSGWQPGGST